MAKYKLQVDLKTDNGTSSSSHEIMLPDNLNSKITNSSYKAEVIPYIESALPQLIGGHDWRKRGWKVVSFNNVVKL